MTVTAIAMVQTKASTSAASWTVIADGISYEPFASIKGAQMGNGLPVANDWGNDGRLASRHLYRTSGGTNLSLLAYSYDANALMMQFIRGGKARCCRKIANAGLGPYAEAL